MNYRILVERSVAEVDLLGGSSWHYQDIAHQSLVENGMVKHLTDALRSTLAWKVLGDNAARKLSTLRFIAQSFQRHLEHLMALEENDGYMDMVTESCPRLSKKVTNLRQEHDALRIDVRRLVHQLENVSPHDPWLLEEATTAWLDVLARLDTHFSKEVDLLQEAFEHDDGGEG
jgi:hemerythrin-like domain-containing protein